MSRKLRYEQFHLPLTESLNICSHIITDLKGRLARIVVGYTYDNKPVTAGDLKAQGAMAALLKDALKPNLVQTLEHTPAFIHGGPFANIAHGCNSVTATRMALKLGDYAITEAGFGADLGAEKFLERLNIHCVTVKFNILFRYVKTVSYFRDFLLFTGLCNFNIC